MKSLGLSQFSGMKEKSAPVEGKSDEVMENQINNN
jgi:hypothetical protein